MQLALPVCSVQEIDRSGLLEDGIIEPAQRLIYVKDIWMTRQQLSRHGGSGPHVRQQ